MLKHSMIFVLLLGLALAASPAHGADKAETAKQIAVLQDASATETVKDEAIRALTRAGSAEAVPALAALLDSPSLATLARGALEAIPDPSASAALRKSLGTLKGRALAGAICSLGNRRDAEAIGEIQKLLGDKDDDVAAAAAGALAKIGGADVPRMLAEALKAAPAGRKGPLADACLHCAGSLQEQGKSEDAVALYNTLRAGGLPEYVVRSATLGVIRVEGAKSQGLVLDALKSDDWGQVAFGLQASRLIPGKSMTEGLCAALRDAKTEKQVLILKALGDRNDPAILPNMLAMAREGDPAARAEALFVIGRIGDLKAVPDLFALAADPQAAVADAAKAVLTGLPGAEVDQAVMERIKAQDAAARLLALELAGKRAIKTAGAELVKLASADPDRKVRQAALRALGDGGGVEEMNALLDMMTKAEAGELNGIESAIRAIATRLGDPKASNEQILARLSGAQAPQRAALLRLAGAQGTPEALEAVRKALNDPDPKVADAAFRVLCDWPNIDAAADLLKLAQAPGKGTRPVLALRGYIRLIGPKSVAPAQKIAMLRQAAPLAKANAEKKQMLGVMQTIANPAMLTMIDPYLDSAEIRTEAAQAALAIAEKLTGVRQAARSAGTDVTANAMKKVLETADNPEIKRRAQAVLDRLAK